MPVMPSVITLFTFLPSFVTSNLIMWDCEYPTSHNLPSNSLVSTDDSEKSHWWLQNDDFIIFIALPHLLARWPSPSASPLPLFHYWCGLINAFLNIQCLLPSYFYCFNCPKFDQEALQASTCVLLHHCLHAWLLTQEILVLPYNFSAPDLELVVSARNLGSSSWWIVFRT